MSLQRVKSNDPPFDDADEKELRNAIAELTTIVETQAATITDLAARVAELEATAPTTIDPEMLLPVDELFAAGIAGFMEAIKGHKAIAFPIE